MVRMIMMMIMMIMMIIMIIMMMNDDIENGWCDGPLINC